MRGIVALSLWRGLAATAAVLALCLLPPVPAGAQPPHAAIHLGVASCAGSNCHGAAHRSKGSAVPQNEYLTWSHWDKHHQAYTVLNEARSRRIAANLGLPDARTARICLNCHTDNVPQDRRGPRFHVADGVGCEACHGGASEWLGLHISGASHQQNLVAGLYPLENPLARAKKCLACHFGNPADPDRFVTHRIMGAGHPRMGFELDTYTMAQPAHFVIDKGYIARNGPVDHAQVWAVGQTIGLLAYADALLSPRLAPRGLFPELVLFDCQSCHHVYDWRQATPPDVAGLPTGWPPLYDANAVMLRIIAARVAPGTTAGLAADDSLLKRATVMNWPAVARATAQLRDRASGLVAAVASHDFTPQDVKVMARALAALNLGGEGANFSVAEQATMGLAALGSAMQMSGSLSPQQALAMTAAINGLDRSFISPKAYRREAFVKALREFRAAVPR